MAINIEINVYTYKVIIKVSFGLSVKIAYETKWFRGQSINSRSNNQTNIHIS